MIGMGATLQGMEQGGARGGSPPWLGLSHGSTSFMSSAPSEIGPLHPMIGLAAVTIEDCAEGS